MQSSGAEASPRSFPVLPEGRAAGGNAPGGLPRCANARNGNSRGRMDLGCRIHSLEANVIKWCTLLVMLLRPSCLAITIAVVDDSVVVKPHVMSCLGAQP